MNLLDPLHFASHAEARQFAQRHHCALCLSQLEANGESVICPNDGVMYEHTVTKPHTAAQVVNDRYAARVELRPKSTRTPEEILKELYPND